MNLSRKNQAAIIGAKIFGDQRQVSERCFIMVKAGSEIECRYRN